MWGLLLGCEKRKALPSIAAMNFMTRSVCMCLSCVSKGQFFYLLLHKGTGFVSPPPTAAFGSSLRAHVILVIVWQG